MLSEQSGRRMKSLTCPYQSSFWSTFVVCGIRNAEQSEDKKTYCNFSCQSVAVHLNRGKKSAGDLTPRQPVSSLFPAPVYVEAQKPFDSELWSSQIIYNHWSPQTGHLWLDKCPSTQLGTNFLHYTLPVFGVVGSRHCQEKLQGISPLSLLHCSTAGSNGSHLLFHSFAS